jgi:proline dehydrogenase
MMSLRAVFIALSEAKGLRSFAETSSLAQRVSNRFVAGTALSQALSVAAKLNEAGISATLDALGENVNSEDEARHAGSLYHTMLDRISGLGLDANVSLKLTQMGLDLGADVAKSIVSELVEHAARVDGFVRVDMEGSPYTQATIDLVRTIHARADLRGKVGVVVQAYLHRTARDVEQLVADGIRLRLCKGAYLEPAWIAFAQKEETDRNYVSLAKMMMKSGVFHGFATHDETIIRELKRFAVSEAIDPRSFEFQMLYGIRRDLQKSLVEDGFRVRCYVPFGGEWYPYFMRRLAERPANVLFIVKNLFKS